MPTLSRVLDVALADSQDMLARELSEVEARGRQISHRAAVLPGLSVNYSFRQEEDQGRNRDLGFQDRSIYTARLSQPLYHWGAKRAEKQIGDAIYGMEMLRTEETRKNVISKTRRDYMALVVLRQDRDRASRALELEQESFALQERQVEAGAASRVTMVSARMDLERAEIEALRKSLEWEEKLEDFALYLGLEPREVEVLLVEEIPEVLPAEEDEIASLDRYFAQALASNESYRRSQLSLEIARKRLKIQKVSLRPKVNAELGMSSNALDMDGTRREQEFTYFGFSVGWNIFDGFRAKGNKMTAAAGLAKEAHALELLEQRLMRGFARQARAIEVARRALRIDELALEMNEGRLARYAEEVEEGRSAESAYENFRQTYLANKIRAQRSRIAYLDAVGNFLLELNVEPAEAN